MNTRTKDGALLDPDDLMDTLLARADVLDLAADRMYSMPADKVDGGDAHTIARGMMALRDDIQEVYDAINEWMIARERCEREGGAA